MMVQLEKTLNKNDLFRKGCQEERKHNNPKNPTHMSAWVKFAKLYLTTMDRQDQSGDV